MQYTIQFVQKGQIKKREKEPSEPDTVLSPEKTVLMGIWFWNRTYPHIWLWSRNGDNTVIY